MCERVVVLSNDSVFCDGIVSRLRQYPNQIDLRVVASYRPDALQQTISAKPSAVILDDSGPEKKKPWSLEELIDALPALMVIRLNTKSPQTQIIQWEKRCFDEIRDLLEMISLPIVD